MPNKIGQNERKNNLLSVTLGYQYKIFVSK